MTTRDNVLLYSQLKKRAGKALPTPTGSNQKPEPVKEVESMAAQTNNTDVFFLQLPQIAPAIAEFLKTYPSTLKASITSGDVTGSYGVRMTIVIAAEVLIEQCPSCAETQFDAPTFDCRWHRFEKRWMQIADAEGSTTEKAMRNLDRVVALWMAGRETRRAA